jgi:hypothetical protein
MIQQKILLIILHFFVSWITEFSTFAELQWLGNFSLLEINYISGLLNFVWVPFIPMGISKVVDWLSKRVGFGTQASITLTVFTLLWFKITLLSVIESQKFTTLLYIALAELGPTTLHILLDASRVQYFNQWDDNILAICEQSKIIGSAVATLFGGYVVHHTDVQYTFFVHSIFFGTTAILALILGYYQRQQFRQYVAVDIDDGCDGTKRVSWNPTLVEEYIIPSEQREKSCVEKLHPSPMIRSFAYFLLIMNMIPSNGGESLFYYMTGPLGINLWEMGIISASSACIEVLAVFCYNKTRLSMRNSAFLSISLHSFGQFAMLIVVTRVMVERLSTYHSIFFIYAMMSFGRGYVMMAYNTVLQDACETGKEAEGMTKMKTFPRFGVIIKWILDVWMVKSYQVNHDEYTQFEMLMTVTVLLWGIGLWSTLIVKNENS